MVLNPQINSHFLCHMFNMIYSNTISESENMPQLILKLADIFRYTTNKNQ
ncbi:histidine kinase [Yeosuana marina]